MIELDEEKREEIVNDLYESACIFSAFANQEAYVLRRVLREMLETIFPEISVIYYDNMIDEALKRFDPECIILD